MTSIHNPAIAQIVATIRAAMAARSALNQTLSGAEVSRRNVPDAKIVMQDKSAELTQGRQGLETLIRKRVNALQADDPQRGRKAMRIFLESVLLGEFGEALINDAGFHQMVDEIQGQMEGDARIAAAMQEAAAQLLGEVDSPGKR